MVLEGVSGPENGNRSLIWACFPSKFIPPDPEGSDEGINGRKYLTPTAIITATAEILQDPQPGPSSHQDNSGKAREVM